MSSYEDAPEWFSEAPEFLQRIYIGIGIADPNWLQERYSGQPPEWARIGGWLRGYGYLAGSLEAIPGVETFRPFGIPWVGTLAPSYLYGAFEAAYRAGYLGMGLGGEDWSFMGRYGAMRAGYERYAGFVEEALGRGRQPSPFVSGMMDLYGARMAYWQGREQFAPYQIGWAGARLLSYADPSAFGVRAYGFPLYGAISQQFYGEAMLPYIREAWAGAGVSQTTSASIRQMIETSPSYWPFQYRPLGQELVQGLGLWTGVQALAMGAQAATQVAAPLTAIGLQYAGMYGPMEAGARIGIPAFEAGDVTWGMRAAALGRGALSTLPVGLRQAGFGLIIGPLETMSLRYAAGMPIFPSEEVAYQQAAQIGVGATSIIGSYPLESFLLERGLIRPSMGAASLGAAVSQSLLIGMGLEVTAGTMRNYVMGRYGPEALQTIQQAFYVDIAWGASPWGDPLMTTARPTTGVSYTPAVIAGTTTTAGPTYYAFRPRPYGINWNPEAEYWNAPPSFRGAYALSYAQTYIQGGEYTEQVNVLAYGTRNRQFQYAVEPLYGGTLSAWLGAEQAAARLRALGYLTETQIQEIIQQSKVSAASRGYRGPFVQTEGGYWTPEPGPMYAAWLRERMELLERTSAFYSGYTGQGNPLELPGMYNPATGLVTNPWETERTPPPVVAPPARSGINWNPEAEFWYAQQGLDRIFTSKATIRVAESGPEHVKVTPLGPQSSRGSLEDTVRSIVRDELLDRSGSLGNLDELEYELSGRISKRLMRAISAKGV